jgi:hypothetical protein
MNKILVDLAEEFSKCFECYEKFSFMLNEEDKENLSPRNNSAFRILINFFEYFGHFTNIENLLRIFNIVNTLYLKFEIFENSCNLNEEIKIVQSFLIEIEEKIVNTFLESIMQSTNFEEKFKLDAANEKIMNLMETLLEKCQFYFSNLNIINDFGAKENLKEKIKGRIVNFYQDILKKNENIGMNSHFFSEEEFSNYLELL